jgi:PAS domain S-box-containing protein
LILSVLGDGESVNIEDHSEWFLKAFRSSPVGSAFIGLKGEILLMNPTLNKMLGYHDETLPFDNIYDFIKLPPEDDEKITTLKKNPDDEVIGEYQVTHQNGMTLWVKTHTKLIQDNSGEPQCFVAHILDITSNKKTEQELEKSEKLSLAGRLATGIAHEVRNPLTSIKGFIQLLKNEGIDRNGYLNVVSDEIDHIESILSELLIIGRPREMRFEWNDFKSILDNVTTLIKSQGNLFNVDIVTAYDSPIPFIYCDGIQMRQVFINLLKNAIEAMPDGGIINVNAGVDGDTLLITIKDQGIGIPTEQYQKLGQPFFTTKENGTGLGLSICYQIIHNHQGHIDISSGENGTTVKVYLPISNSQSN